MSTSKPKTTKPLVSPNRKTKKPVVLASVTKKLENRELKRALSRRQRLADPQGSFDEAVPASLHIKHLLRAASAELAIRQGTHELSPFVVNLKQILPTPETLLEDSVNIRLNFLHPSMRNWQLAKPEPTDLLTFHKDDILFQLQENTFTKNKKQHLATNTPQIVRQKPVFEPAMHIENLRLPNQSTISLDTFLPQRLPEDLMHYFDIPEEEPDETDESDLMELSEAHEIHATIFEEEPLPEKTKKTRKPFRFPVPSFPPLLRPVGVFILISFVFVLPLHAMNVVSGLRHTKTQVESASQEAFSYLQSGASATAAQESNGASQAFSQASARFSRAQASITDLGIGTSLLLSTIPQAQSKFAAGKNLLDAGEHLTTAGSYLAGAMEAIARETNPTPVSRVRLLQSYLRTALPHLSQANELMQDVEAKEIPEEYQTTFTDIQKRLPLIVQTLSEFNELSDLAIQILGGESTKRYLIIFQNNTEIRPTGGFMGSFAELKMRNGVMENLSVPTGGTYELQGLLRRSRIAPLPLQLLSARWEFQDANWFPDFPTSARQIIELYQDAGGPSVDGVIAVNATYVADLIGLLGPIEMPDYERTIDAENFLFEAQKIVEVEYDRIENKPKQFIGDLAPKLVERALEGDPQQFLNLIDHLSTGLTQKEVQLYFTDEHNQRAMLENRWGGAITQTDSDYLMLVDTNLGGGKTDGVIEEKIDVSVQINQQGSITNTVTITRKHNGIKNALFSGSNNVNYMRLYVPKGSELIEASGFTIPDISLFDQPQEDWVFDDDLQYVAVTASQHQASKTDITEEQGKTVFGNWVQTAPGETSTIQFTYKLPFQLFEKSEKWGEQFKAAMGIEPSFPYSLTIQKQAGTINRTTNVSVQLPETTHILWKSQDLAPLIFDNTTDAFFALLLK